MANAQACILVLLSVWLACGCAENTTAQRGAAPTGIVAARVAVVVNERDTLSRQIGDYYAVKRAIPRVNLISVSFKPGRVSMTRRAFAKIMEQVTRATPAGVQAYVLTWAQPYKVECMSITTAFAAGFDESWCAEGCTPTRHSAYYDSNTRNPFAALGMRPTMTLAATSFEQAKALIDRGIAADGSRPEGTGYLVKTVDRRRNVRAAKFPALVERLGQRLALRFLETDSLEGRDDIFFYFTGGKEIAGLDRNRYLPGAIADHLTSGGGKLTGGKQMSSLRWLEAGATGSYGAVVEPCNFAGKFPDPGIVIERYTAGETLLEAYWKSVQMPGQGIFIGEPLARPFAPLATAAERAAIFAATTGAREL